MIKTSIRGSEKIARHLAIQEESSCIVLIYLFSIDQVLVYSNGQITANSIAPLCSIILDFYRMMAHLNLKEIHTLFTYYF